MEAKKTSAIVSSTFVTFLAFTIIITVTLILSTRVAISTISKVAYYVVKNLSLNMKLILCFVLKDNELTSYAKIISCIVESPEHF